MKLGDLPVHLFAGTAGRGFAAATWLGDCMLIMYSAALFLLLVLMCDQVCVIYQWYRKTRENRRKNHKPDSHPPDALIDALAEGGIFGERKTEREDAVDCWAYGSVDATTISKALAENRVVKITPTEDGKFEVREMCDEYFGATLTADQLAAWGRELIELSCANEKAHR